MTAIQTDRNTATSHLERSRPIPLAAAAKVPAGVIIAYNAAGLVPNLGSADTAGLVVAGRSAHPADQTAGDLNVVATCGVFGFDAAPLLTAAGQAACGRAVYLVDNHTVGLEADTANAVFVGVLEYLEDGQFFVSVGMHLSPDSLS